MSVRCMFCGEPEDLAIAEIWQDGNFQLATCCLGLLESVALEMQADPLWGRELLRRLGAEDLTGYQLRRVNDDQGNGPVLDYRLRIADVAFSEARAFISRHHAHCDPTRAWRFGFSVFNGAALMGVATVGNPVAPTLMKRGIAEVNRLCIRRDLNPMLRWNCCSMLYAHSAREAERRGFNRIITYTRVDEDGASLRAAGWTCEGLAGGRGWHSSRRSRSNRNAWIKKLRWSRTLQPKLLPQRRLSPAPSPGDEWLFRPATRSGIP
jgi:hypothetical protein